LSYVDVPIEKSPSLNGWAEGPTALLGKSIFNPHVNKTTAVPLNGGKGSRRSVGRPAQEPAERATSSFAKRNRGFPDIQPDNHSTDEKLTPGNRPEQATAKCGEVLFQIVCPDHPDDKHLRSYACHGASCPICWESWASRAAEDAASRIEGFQSITGSADPRHISFSPPPGRYGKGDREKMTQDLNHLLKAYGISAMVAIPHPYRLIRGDDDDVPEESRSNRYRRALDSPSWFNKVYTSPHLHGFVFGSLPPFEEFQAVTGWVYRNHDSVGGGRSGDSLRATLYYLLTHAWVNGNARVVRYWFGISTRRMGRVEMPAVYETVECPVCKAPMVKIPPDRYTVEGVLIVVFQDLHNAPKATIKRKQWQYYLKSKRTRY
jgi:hypothetical protein